VIFDPTATGSRSGTLQVVYSAPGSPQTVSLSGTGVAPTAVASVTTLSYSHNLNTTCPSKPVIVQNTGTGPLLISNITTTGSFSQTNTCGTSVAVGASCEIDVTFTAESPVGSYSGTLTVTDNAGKSTLPAPWRAPTRRSRYCARPLRQPSTSLTRSRVAIPRPSPWLAATINRRPASSIPPRSLREDRRC
jgi:hypothetical protein